MPRGGKRPPRKSKLGIDWSERGAKTKLRRMRGTPQQAKMVTIDGVEYPSQAAAARALGLTRQAIQRREREKNR